MKIFAVSDIHGFYDEFKKSLIESGFEENNPNHLLVCCGDYLDRGRQPIQIIEYLMSLNNVVLVRGNHEDLMSEMLMRGFPQNHDYSNGTVQSVGDIIEEKNSIVSYKDVYNYLKPFYNKMVDYFETENYVFVHGWVPTTIIDNKNWRHGDWKEARWLNGMEFNHKGFNPTDKTVICGHWHCSYGWSHIAQKYKEFPQLTSNTFRESFQPYREDGIIAIDACTAYSKIVNVIVLEDNLIGEL